MGLACDVNGTHPVPSFNGGVPGPGLITGTSLDGTYAPGTSIANLPIDLGNSTGTETLTLTSSSPACTAGGFANSKCMCDTCNNPAAEICQTHADCPLSGVCRGGTNALQFCDALTDCPDQGAGTSCGGAPCASGADCVSAVCNFPSGFPGECSTLAGRCGGPRCLGGATNPGAPCFFPPNCSGGTAPCGVLGEPTKPNACQGTCTQVAGAIAGEGECAMGPFGGKCTPSEPFKGCNASSECTFPGDTCVFGARDCFLDNGAVGGSIVAVGAPDAPVNDAANPKLVSAFCIKSVGQSSVNTAAGLPGPGRVSLRGLARGLP
jgi:hypothetical protein